MGGEGVGATTEQYCLLLGTQLGSLTLGTGCLA